MKTSANKGSALALMELATIGTCIGVLVGYGFARLAGLSPATCAWIAGPAVPVALLWGWFHRAPGNTHFVNILSTPAVKPGKPFRLMAKAILAVLFLGVPQAIMWADVAGLGPFLTGVLAGAVLAGVPVWLWFHRSPDNNRFILRRA